MLYLGRRKTCSGMVLPVYLAYDHKFKVAFMFCKFGNYYGAYNYPGISEMGWNKQTIDFSARKTPLEKDISKLHEAFYYPWSDEVK